MYYCCLKDLKTNKIILTQLSETEWKFSEEDYANGWKNLTENEFIELTSQIQQEIRTTLMQQTQIVEEETIE